MIIHSIQTENSQLKISRLPSTLTLAPNQVAIVPISFLPRFPTQTNILSNVQQLDMEYWLVGSNNKHQNMWTRRSVDEDELHVVSTHVFVETNRGVLRMPIEATSIRKNDYQVPDTIQFIQRQEPQKVTIEDNDPRQQPATFTLVERVMADRDDIDRPPNRRINPQEESEGCYDVYMKHPNSHDEDADNLHVIEALVSDPDSVHLKIANVDPGRKPNKGPHQVISSFETVVPGGSGSGGQSPLVIPPDDSLHYVVTVCLGEAPHDPQLDDYLQEISPFLEPSGDSWLGFLQIRTDIDTLFIGLERAAADLGARMQVPSLFHEAFEGRGLNESNAGVDNSTGTVDDEERDQEPDTTFEPSEDEEEEEDGEEDSVLHVYPDEIHIRLISSASPTARVPIDLYNAASEAPVTIMRISVIWQASEIGLDDAVGFACKIPGEGLDAHIPIEFNETLEDAFFLECSVDWDKFMKEVSHESLEFRGIVILRGTTEDWDFSVWETAIHANPFLDSDVVVEVPFSVKLIKGKIGFLVQETSHPYSLFWATQMWTDTIESVTNAFFPLHQRDVRSSFGGEGREDFFSLKAIEHRLRVFSNLGDETRVKNVDIIPEVGSGDPVTDKVLCDRFEVKFSRNGESNSFDIWNSTDLGLVELTYRFNAPKADFSHGDPFPETCLLRLTTEPDTGEHLLPLTTYSGRIQVSGFEFRSGSVEKVTNMTTEDGVKKTVWQRTVAGFDRVADWILNNKAGLVFKYLLGTDAWNLLESDSSILSRYCFSLLPQSLNPHHLRMQPVLLEAGAVAQGELEVLPLYLTNHNPVPVQVAIDVGEVEGLTIALSRESTHGQGDGNHLLDYLPRKPLASLSLGGGARKEPQISGAGGKFAGHPVNGLRQFLRTDRFADSFLSGFPYRDSVSLSDSAVSDLPILERLYHSYALPAFHKSAIPARLGKNAWNRCGSSVHPPMYGSFEKKLTGRKLQGPLIISNDGKSGRRLPVCWGKDMDSDDPSDGTVVVVPPGGVARFDLTLRSPLNSVLDKDITQFMATGLVLSTNLGEILPIMVSFEALQGKLDVSHLPSTPDVGLARSHGSSDNIIHVPAGLFERPILSGNRDGIVVPPRPPRGMSYLTANDIVTRNASVSEKGVPLFMWSSFTRDVRLLEISSCNPWFEVVLDSEIDTDIDPILGARVGMVKSTIACSDTLPPPSNISGHPFFFRCVLNWLAKRSEIQPTGCGLPPAKERRSGDESGRSSDRGSIDRAVRSMARAMIVSEWAYGALEVRTTGSHLPWKTGRRSVDGIVPKVFLDAMADAWDSWRSVADLGLQALSTNLRAIIEYNSTSGSSDEKRSHVLSVAVPNATVETILEVPRLLDTAKVSSRQSSYKSAIEEPSVVEFPGTDVGGVSSLVLPLRNPTSVPIRVSLAVAQTESVSFGKSFDFRTEFGLDQKVINDFVGYHPPPFVQGRPRRREVAARDNWWDESGGFFQVDFKGDIIRSHYNITLIAGKNAQVSFYKPSLLSHSSLVRGCGSRCGIREETGMTPVVIGASSSGNTPAQELKIAAGGSPSSSGVGPPAFAIPYAALDEIIIPPFGEAEVGPILFRPPGRFKTVGCDVQIENGASEDCTAPFESVVFLENSVSGLERVVLRGKGQVEKIDFIDAEPTPDLPFGSIEQRNGQTTVIFPGTSVRLQNGPAPVVREAIVVNSGDVPIFFKSMSLSHVGRPHERHMRGNHKCMLRDFHIIDCEGWNQGFSLLPGQNRSFFIEHTPSCIQRKDFVALSLEIDRKRIGWRDEQLAMDPATFLTKISTSGSRRYERANAMNERAKASEAILILGYEMSKKDFLDCVPVRQERDGLSWWRFLGSARLREPGLYLQLFLVVILLTAAAVTAKYSHWRSEKFKKFYAVLHSSKSSGISGSNWFATFRCLARVDPTSSDLQALGREQVRQIVLSRYKSMGILQPQCVASSGAFHRERGVVQSRLGRQQTNGKEGDRSRTLSDAIFRKYNPPVAAAPGVLPCQLGWRIAVSKGIIDDSPQRSFSFASRAEKLLAERLLEEVVDDDDASDDDDEEEEDGLSEGASEDVDDDDSETVSNGIDVKEAISGSKSPCVHETQEARVSVGSLDNGDTGSDILEVEPSAGFKEVSSTKLRKTGDDAPPTEGDKVRETTKKETERSIAKVPEERPVKKDSVQASIDKIKTTSEYTSESSPKCQRANATKYNNQNSRDNRSAKDQRKKEKKDDSAEKRHEPGRKTRKPDSNVGRKEKKIRSSKADQVDETKSTTPESIPSKELTATASNAKMSANKKAKGTKKDRGSRKHERKEIPIIRPPPGLAPPPGFGDSADLFAQTAAATEAAKSILSGTGLSSGSGRSSSDPTASSNTPLASSQGIGGSPILPVPILPPTQPTSSLYDQQLHGGLGGQQPRRDNNDQDFDIMDFLDGVLDEHVGAEEEEEPNLVAVPISVSPENSGSNLTIPAISANPWAATSSLQPPSETSGVTGGSEMSRLFAYGIPMEDVSESASGVDPIRLPLLTPAEILSRTQDSQQEEEDEKDQGSSFYSSLLGE